MFSIMKFLRNCGAVSEVMGSALMTGIAIIMLSGIAISVFSHDGPADVPKTNVQELINVKNDTLCLKHSGGDIIDTEEIEIAININGVRHVYPSSNISASLNKNIWEPGDVIYINTSKEWGSDLTYDDSVDVYVIDKPSDELIQNFKCSVDDNRRMPPLWNTPGKVVDNSVDPKEPNLKGSAKPKDVEKEKDGHNTTYYPPNKQDPDLDKYELFEFDINPEIYGYREGDYISNVTLYIVYHLHDNSNLNITLYAWDETPIHDWHPYPLPENKNKLPSNFSNVTTTKLSNGFTAYSVFLDLSDCINTTQDTENLKLKFVAVENANSGKTISVDYVAIKIT